MKPGAAKSDNQFTYSRGSFKQDSMRGRADGMVAKFKERHGVRDITATGAALVTHHVGTVQVLLGFFFPTSSFFSLQRPQSDGGHGLYIYLLVPFALPCYILPSNVPPSWPRGVGNYSQLLNGSVALYFLLLLLSFTPCMLLLLSFTPCMCPVSRMRSLRLP